MMSRRSPRQPMNICQIITPSKIAGAERSATSLCEHLQAAGPRVAWWHVKKNMKVAEEGSLAEALDSEAARMIRTGETQDHKEAARAFVEKRAPVFKGY